MSNPFGWDLPAGVTDKMIDDHMGGDDGVEKCDACDGKGNYVDTDGETYDCDECEGKGEIHFSIRERRKQLQDEAAEARWEEREERRRLGD